MLISDHHAASLSSAGGMEPLWEYDNAEFRERARIAALLHDEVGQCVAVIGLVLDRWSAAGNHNCQPYIDDIRQALSRLDRSWRRAVSRPEPLQAPDMLPALAKLCRTAEREMQLHCSVQESLNMSPPTPAGGRVLLRGVGELLLNVRKHADSPYVNVNLGSHGPWVEVAVRDYGTGPSEPTTEPRRVRGFGLMNLKRELRTVGGDMRVDAVDPGRSVRLRVPTLQSDYARGART